MQRLPPEFAVLDQEHLLVEPFATWAMAITYIPMARGFVYLAVAHCRGAYRSRWKRHSASKAA
jgi:hypothetical protein